LPDLTPSFLVIRRDNIGDLVCTTPVFRALRERFPAARICALVNSYNLPVLRNNPDIDEIFAYTKAKHRPAGQSLFGVYRDRLKTVVRLRAMRFDYAILAAPGFQPRSLAFARLVAPRHIVGFSVADDRACRAIDINTPYLPDDALHEAEDVFRVLAPLGIVGAPPPARVFPGAAECAAIAAQAPVAAMRIAIHISARKPSQRWPAQRFVELMRRLHRETDCAFVLFWSPGDDANPFHPGDDAKARQIVEALPDIPLLAYPTVRLEQLIAGLSLCDAAICSDGGAMHLAAGLGKPILCFFGKSGVTRWHPWGVPHIVLQPESREVTDITVEEALAAFMRLLKSGEERDSIGETEGKEMRCR